MGVRVRDAVRGESVVFAGMSGRVAGAAIGILMVLVLFLPVAADAAATLAPPAAADAGA